tara:strand:- start:8463 stop:9173 length:711 start_codon:yes stop_codon:yes gene_type:complete
VTVFLQESLIEMTKNTAEKIKETLQEHEVIQYLEQNSDFFTQKIELFEKMTLPRKKGGQIASFGDFQNMKLTKKIAQMEERQKRIMATALQNIESTKQINQLTLDLLHSTTKESMMNHFRNVIENELNLDSAQVILKHDNPEGYQQACTRNFKDGQSVCLRTAQNENACLHSGGGDGCIKSEALILLTNKKQENFGILTLGSQDIERFHEGQGVELLEFLGGIISYKLQEFLADKG